MSSKASLVVAAVIIIAVCAAYIVFSQETDTPVENPVLPGDDLPSMEEDGHEEEQKMDEIYLDVNGRTFAIILEDTEAAEALFNMLPMSLDMEELNGNEKYCYIEESLPTSIIRPGTINTGDVMLYGDSCLVVFYETFRTSYSYTPIGHIADPSGLAEALGDSDVTVSFSQIPSADPAE